MAELDRRQFLVGTAGGAILLRLPPEASGVSKRALRELKAAVRGRVLVPHDSTRIVYNRRFEGLRPDAVVHVENTADVAAAVRWADRFDVRVVARSGGHSYAGYSSTGDGVVLDLSKLRGVRVAGGRATVGPGAQLIDVQRALTRRGVTVPSGSCPSVGIGGLALGGGHGLAGRRFGLTSDNLLAARIVTADGRVRARGRRHERGPLLGLPRRRRRQLRDRDRAHPQDPPGAGRRVVHRLVAVVAGEEALAAWQRFAPDAPPALTSIFSLGTTRRLRLPARGRARPVLRSTSRSCAGS